MSAKSKISIPTPCSQKWDDMDLAENGRFCKHCEKEVVDFTKMSVTELRHWFGSTPGKVCGRIMPGQLETFGQQFTERENRTSMITKVLVAACLTFVANLKTNAANMVQLSTQHYFSSNLTDKKTQKNEPDRKPDSLIKIIGIIKDVEDGLPVPGAKISVKNTNLIAFADALGKFTLKVSNENAKIILVCNSLGYFEVEKEVALTNPIIEVMIKADQVVLGEMVIVEKRYPNFFLNTGINLFRKIKRWLN